MVRRRDLAVSRLRKKRKENDQLVRESGKTSLRMKRERERRDTQRESTK